MLLPVKMCKLLTKARFVPRKGPISAFVVGLKRKFVRKGVLTFLNIVTTVLLLLLMGHGLRLRFVCGRVTGIRSAGVGRMSRCGFLSHCNSMNRCLHLRLGLYFHGGAMGARFHVKFVVVLTFSTLVTFASICSKAKVVGFVYVCGFTVLDVVALKRIVSFRNGCLSNLVDHGRSVCGLLHTGCCLGYVVIFVPFLVVVVPMTGNGVPFLVTLSCVLFAAKFMFTVVLRLTICGGGALPLGTGIVQDGQKDSLFRAVVVSYTFFLPLVVGGTLATFFRRSATYVVVVVVKLLLVTARGV